MRYLVTGAAGFIGSHLVDALDAAGHDVVGLDCLTDYYDVELKEANLGGRDVLRLDLAEDGVELGGYDGVFHLAGQPGVRSFGAVFPLYLRRNVLATQRLFEAAAAAGVRVVWASSSSVYGDAETYPTPERAAPRPRSPYGITKLACEHLARAYANDFGLEAIALRYFTVYGPRQRPDMFMTRVVTALAEGGSIELYGDGCQSRSFTYVGDAVSATVAAMAHGRSGAVYNVGGGEEATLRNAIGLLERLSSRRLDIRYGPAAAGDLARTSADVSLIGRDVGWRPRTPLAEGLAAQWEWALGRVATR